MEEVTSLQINRERLRESFFYYNGCETKNRKDSETEAANDVIIDLAADVLAAILTKKCAS